LKRISRNRKLVFGAGIAVVLGGLIAVGAGTSQAGESCQGLDSALRGNLNFIADQRRNPDAQSAARIANRQAVVDLIQQRRQVAGCTADIHGKVPASTAPATATKPAAQQPATGGGGGQVVCAGSTVTLFNEDAAPAASSGQFPIGTRLRVTNLDNNKSTTVTITSTSGTCVLLNNAAFELVREPGKFVIRRAVIERVS
jgi:hypothetical protein